MGICRRYGSPNGFDFILKDGTYIPQKGTGSKIPMKKGDVARMVTGAGGGYGNPLKRPVEKVVMDVKNGYVTLQGAQDIYGVFINPDTYSVIGISDARKEIQG